MGGEEPVEQRTPAFSESRTLLFQYYPDHERQPPATYHERGPQAGKSHTEIRILTKRSATKPQTARFYKTILYFAHYEIEDPYHFISYGAGL